MTHVQSVLFDRNYYDINSASKFINENKKFHIMKQPDITDRFLRFRQVNPDYSKYYYKTKQSPHYHIDFIIGYPKKKGGILSNLSEALEVANNIQDDFEPKKLHIVGSILRKEPVVKDIDFITKNDLPNGREYIKFKQDGFNIDIWKVNNLLFGRLIRGYPRHLIIALRKALKNKGYKLSNDELLKDNKKVKIKKIQTVFRLAGIKYRPI